MGVKFLAIAAVPDAGQEHIIHARAYIHALRSVLPDTGPKHTHPSRTYSYSSTARQFVPACFGLRFRGEARVSGGEAGECAVSNVQSSGAAKDRGAVFVDRRAFVCCLITFPHGSTSSLEVNT